MNPNISKSLFSDGQERLKGTGAALLDVTTFQAQAGSCRVCLRKVVKMQSARWMHTLRPSTLLSWKTATCLLQTQHIKSQCRAVEFACLSMCVVSSANKLE